MISITESEIMSTWNRNIGNPVVTIRCLTYNHAKYLGQTIDSFLNQVTSFPFEIVIHDDASTDGTTDILREYAKRFPNIIVPIIQTENQYNKPHSNIRKTINEKIRGKYVALCEGDDYWTDVNKLQIQVDFMEKHPNCVLSMHNGRLYNEKKNKLEKKINPYRSSGFLKPIDVLVEKKMFPPTASIMYVADIEKKRPEVVFKAPVGDRPLRMFFLTKGDIYYSDKCMCVYRYNQGSGSFGSRVKANPQYALDVYERMISFYDRYDEYTNHKYQNEMNLLRSKEEYNYYNRIGEKDKASKTIYFTTYYPMGERVFLLFRHSIVNALPDSIVSVIKRILSV